MSFSKTFNLFIIGSTQEKSDMIVELKHQDKKYQPNKYIGPLKEILFA